MQSPDDDLPLEDPEAAPDTSSAIEATNTDPALNEGLAASLAAANKGLPKRIGDHDDQNLINQSALNDTLVDMVNTEPVTSGDRRQDVRTDDSPEAPETLDSDDGRFRGDGISEDYDARADAERNALLALTDTESLYLSFERLDDAQRLRVQLAAEDLAALVRMLRAVVKALESLGTVPSGLLPRMVMQAQIVEDEAKSAADNSDGQAADWLKSVLNKMPIVGKRLVSIGLHSIPVREWTLGGKASVFFIEGEISVTFGK